MTTPPPRASVWSQEGGFQRGLVLMSRGGWDLGLAPGAEPDPVPGVCGVWVGPHSSRALRTLGVVVELCVSPQRYGCLPSGLGVEAPG